MTFCKYPPYKHGNMWMGHHYIDHTSNHIRNTEIRKKYRSKSVRRWARDAWNRHNRALHVTMPCHLAFCRKEEL